MTTTTKNYESLQDLSVEKGKILVSQTIVPCRHLGGREVFCELEAIHLLTVIISDWPPSHKFY